MQQRIVVTGVAGFIGSNVAEALIRKGYFVVGIDNMSQGHELNMAAFRQAENFQFHHVDIRDEAAILRTCYGCHGIVHLAAYKIPRYSDALDTLMINSLGSHSLAKAALENDTKIIAASTSDVYGKNPALPFHEESEMVIGSPKVRRWAYAISKMFEEQLLFAYHDRHKLRVTLMRFFGGYGPNQHMTWWGGPQSVFINKAIEDQELEVHGDGAQTRSFTYISDHVDGIIRCYEKPEADNDVFNIGATREITILGLAQLVWRLVRGEAVEPKIRLIPYATFGRYEDVMRRVPDISKAQKVLGFSPKVDLEEGLKKTIAWQVRRRHDLGMANPHVPKWL